MMTVNTAFDLYLDAQIILLISALVWFCMRMAMRRTRMATSYLSQLQIAYAGLLAVVFAPLIAALVGYAARQGLIDARYTVNLSDFAVAQFLDGNISLAPTRFETLLASRDVLTLNVTTFASDWGAAIAVVLCAGTLFFVLRMLRNMAEVRGLVQDSYLWHRIGRVDIRLTDAIVVPFSTRGPCRHTIILPACLLAHSSDVRVAVAHELQHIRQRDLSWEIAIEVVRPLFFWNPAFGYWKRQIEELRELSCDQRVLDRPRISVRAYCECLLRVCQSNLQSRTNAQLTVPLAHINNRKSGTKSARFLKFRVESILRDDHLQASRGLSLLLICGLTFAISFSAIAAQRTGDWSQDRLMLSTIVNLERLQLRNGSGN